MNISSKISLLGSLALSTLLYSCSDLVTDTREETGIKGHISIAVDETLKPVMEQQMKVWDSSYPDGKIDVLYTDENTAYKELFKDSVRLIITTKDITEEEKKWGESKKIVYSSLPIARDAAAIIIHPDAQDKKMTMGMLENILNGNFPRQYNIVFDNPGSSLIRMVQDSVMKGKPFDTSKVFAAGTSEKVIEYVANNKNALGIVGLSHIYDPNVDNGYGSFKKNIQVVALQSDTDTTNDFYQPYQVYIASKDYPLTRTIYFVTREQWKGLGTGFVNFLCIAPGQTIFKKAYMVPLRVQLQIIDAKIN